MDGKGYYGRYYGKYYGKKYGGYYGYGYGEKDVQNAAKEAVAGN